MKKLFTLLLLLSAFTGKSQSMYPYSFAKSTGTYQYLTGATSITPGIAWHDTFMTIPLGFTFKWALDNRNVDSIIVDSRGIFYAPQDVDFSFGFPIPGKIMMAYYGDLADRSTYIMQAPMSPISYLTSGTAPNRICKIEFRNAGFYNDISGSDSTNFQVWLYEGSNIIEFRYGPQYVSDLTTAFDGEIGPLVNLVYSSTLDIGNSTLMLDTCTYVSGNENTAVPVYSTSPIDLFSPISGFAFDGLPANGQIFRWSPYANTNSVNDLTAFNHIKVYPTPFNNTLHIENQNALQAVRLSDLHGRVWVNQDIRGTKTDINTSELSSGIYFLSLTDEKNNTKTIKVVK